MWRAALFFCVMLSGPARAVIVSGGDGTGNNTATDAGSGWNYVGAIGEASGIYLGSYGGSSWVLTAAHVTTGHEGALTFTLNGVTYQELGSEVSLFNGAVDLVLFQISGNPGLTNLTLSSSTPSAGTSVTMIGYGTDRASSETYWDSSWNVTTNPVLGVHKGYQWGSTATKRWGQNTIASMGVIEGNTEYFTTTFGRNNSTAQATVGDSGGGVFVNNGGTWELAGVMGLVDSYSGQLSSTSVYNTHTYSADISVYRSQILDIFSPSAVPEPTAFGLLLIGLVLIVFRTRRGALR